MQLARSLALVLLASCSSPPAAPARPVVVPLPAGATASIPVATGSAPAAALAAPTPSPQVAMPDWLGKRAGAAAAALVGGDADSIDVLFGQFEHPEEAIVRFDRKTGCASEAIGPWPILAKIVRGRSDFSGPRLSKEATLAAAHSSAFRNELAPIVAFYTKRGRRGEDKLSFSRDGKSLLMEATDERLIASNDGGEHWQYLDGKNVRMPTVSPDGRYAIVQTATFGPGLVTFDAPTRVKPLGAPFLNDAIFGDSSASVLLVRSDRTTQSATKVCIETLGLPAAAPAKKLGCVPTTQAGSWHMATPSPDARLAVIAAVKKGGAVRLSVRSLVDGSEREAFDVPGDWERYQWIDVMVSGRGVVAYNEVSRRGGPLDDAPAQGDVVVLGGGVTKRSIPNARALGWMNERELVYVDRGAMADAHGCGLVRTFSAEP